MDNKQKEQLKKGLVFGGPGSLFAPLMRFIFTPSGKDKSAAQQGLSDNIPQTTTEQPAGNKLKAYELSGKNRQDEQTREEMDRFLDCLDSSTAPPENGCVEAAASTAKIESSVYRYEGNNRLLNSFYAPDPDEQEREALCSESDNLRKELISKNEDEGVEEKRRLALTERSYQMVVKYLSQSSSVTATTNIFTPAKGKGTLETPTTEQASSTGSLPATEVLAERKQVVPLLNQPMIGADFVQ